MEEKKLHHKYESKEQRLEAWREQRALYDEWRASPDGVKWVRRKSRTQFNLCFICMTPLTPPVHVDHIFPLYLGGTSSSANMCVTHADCNMRKGAKVYMTFKEACTRRRHFNHLTTALTVHRMMVTKPGYVPRKRQAKSLKQAYKYFSIDEFNSMALARIETDEQGGSDNAIVLPPIT